MRRFLAIAAAAGLISGCAWFSSSETTEATPQAATAEAAPQAESVASEPLAEAPAKTAKASKSAKTAKAAKTTKGAKSESQIKAELDQMAHKLVAQSSRTLLPNKANKEVRQVGGQWVATYNQVDVNNVHTEMRPGASPGLYVGIIQYNENIFECRGASRQAALSAPCEQARSRRMRELISYDGKKWND